MAGGSSTELMRVLSTVETCVTQRQLTEQLGWPYPRVQAAMAVLRRRKMVERVHPDCYRATPALRSAYESGMQIKSGPKGKHTGRRKPPQNTFRQRVWGAIRRLERFTLNDLLSYAATEAELTDCERVRGNAKKYLQFLQRVGYVAALKHREPGVKPSSNGFQRYLLLPEKNTGPSAPRLRGTKGMFDPNLGRDIAFEVRK